MTDRAAFIAFIRDNPDDDAPRLAFADWLDEHGEPEWAEFIRVQVELARVDPGELVGSVRRRFDAMKKREHDLLNKSIYRSMPSLWFKLIGRDSFVRGFLESIIGTAVDCLAHLDAILVEHPVRDVTLTTLPITDQTGTETKINGPWRLLGDPTKLLITTDDWGKATGTSFEQKLLSARWLGITFHLPTGRDLNNPWSGRRPGSQPPADTGELRGGVSARLDFTDLFGS